MAKGTDTMVHFLFTEAPKGEDGLRPRASISIEQFGITKEQAVEAFQEMIDKGCTKFAGWVTYAEKEDGKGTV